MERESKISIPAGIFSGDSPREEADYLSTTGRLRIYSGCLPFRQSIVEKNRGKNP